jgi:peptidoglycan/LPS O-acetylase OafA/YrhL
MTAVVAQHCGLMPFGWTGVWLFFVISGYVVTLSVISRPSDKPAKRRLTDFFRRRAYRIVPVYYAYVGVGFLICLVTGQAIDSLTAGSLLGFFFNFAMAMGSGELGNWHVGHLWTISIEMQFYVLYGTVLIMASRRTVIFFLVSALAISPLLRLAVSLALIRFHGDAESNAFAIYSGSFLHTDSFAAGALLAFASERGLLSRIARPLAGVGLVALAVYISIYVGLNYASGARGIDALRDVLSGILWGQMREVFVYSALAIAGAGLVAIAASEDRSLAWLLKHRLLQRIGEISYGAYVYHTLMIAVALKVLPLMIDLAPAHRAIISKIALFALSYVMTVIVSELSFRHFESRFIGGRHRSSRKFDADAASKSATMFEQAGT